MRKILISICTLACALAAAAQGSADQFGVKAMYVDCRTEVMTMEAIKALAHDVASKGMNAMLMEWEATFPFERNATLCNQYAFTREQIKEFVEYCDKLGIDVIPLQNCFGHSEYILRHDRYYDLREDNKEVSQVCPLKIDKATPVFTDIFKEVAELHPSKYFHIGADETYLLGSCRHCQAVAAQHSKSKLFVDYINAMSKIVLEMGKIPVIWADIILENPEAVKELSDEIIFVDWNYGWEPDRFGKLQNLFDAGVKMWGASALRSYPDNVYLTQWKKHFDNLAVFIPFAREKGYTGMIQTSWSTGGTYGFHYDVQHEIINMQPIRSVYPQSAFNILIAATAKAFTTAQPLDPHQFVLGYAKDIYGISEAEAEILWDYFCMPQEVYVTRNGKDDKGTPIATLIEQCYDMKKKLAGISPKKGKQEFAHYPLMLDIRINYLLYKEIETAYESASYTRSQASGLATRLAPIVKEGDKLMDQFFKMNKGYLKDGELRWIQNIYLEKMKALQQWLLANK